ncbi:flagellar export chaperone FlgN [Candidatus Colwellia aromaticivorans]|uniref:flagellar export chaperone FlgN n=1 Tax=Candidatus Colwellia aromaticivorans TaxID=2267621 RepID=UPI000DF48D5D|nr:flagellar export chaperone FlgN [Candidatus Colwellia aromaticivorans]
MSASIQSQELLAQQFAQLQELEQIITDEKLVLQQHQPDALLQISEKKNQLLLSIQNLDKQISINQIFAQDKAAGLLSQELADIESLLKLCQQKNQVNGQIIAQSQLAVERMKTSLLESHNKTSVTYDSKGKKSGGLSSIGLKA